MFLALLVGAGGCDLEPITSQPPISEPPTRPMAPSAPGRVEARAEPGTVTLSWSPPEHTGSLTGYRVRAEPLGSAPLLEVNEPTARVTGLSAGATYRFSVAAVNEVGEGPATRSEAVTLPEPPSAPPQPSVVRGDGQVRVSWTEPATDGRSPLTGYIVTAHPQGIGVTVDASMRSAVVEGLSNGEPSTFTVRALNAVGEGPDSPASPSVVPARAPSAPASVEATADIRQATVTWNAPENTGGLPMDTYVVTAEPGGASRQVGAESRSVTFTGLDNGTAYAFTVVARNEVGEGAGLRSAPVRTPDVPARPGEVRATRGVRSATVTWEAPAQDGGAPLTGFIVEASPSGARVQVDAQTHSATFTDLSSTKAHAFTVSALNAVGSSAASAPSAAVRPLPVPAEVTDLQVDTSDAGCLTVSYALRQADGLRADILVEVATQGAAPFTRATQAGSIDHEGLLARSSSPEGDAHGFLWNRGHDVPGATTVQLRLSAQVPGAAPGSATLELSLPAAARRCEVRLPTSIVQPLAHEPLQAVNGDFNRDGKPDLAVAMNDSSTVAILLGLGNGGFQPPIQHNGIIYGVGHLGAADLDGDGADELLVPDQSGRLWVARNVGHGMFLDPVSYSLGTPLWRDTTPGALAFADLDGDGSLDVATLGWNNDRWNNNRPLGILANTGDGTLGGFTRLGTSVASNAILETADFDEDGREDLLAFGPLGGSTVLLANGDGTFRERAITSMVHADSVAVGDLDGDGHLDLALAAVDSSDPTQLYLARGDGQGGFSPAQLVDSLTNYGSPRRVALTVVDLDHDGLEDLVVGVEWDHSLAVLRGRGAGLFAPAVMLPAGHNPIFATRRDFDGDGVQDVAAVQRLSKDVRVWRGGAEALSLSDGLTGTFAQGDFNADGRMDLVNATQPDNVQVLLTGASDGPRAQEPVAMNGSIYQLVVGHVDGDAALDVLVLYGGYRPSSFGLLLGNGDGTLRRAADIPIGAMPEHATLGDVNGDGRMDIVCRVHFAIEPGYYTTEVWLLLGQGDGTFAPATVVTTSPNPGRPALGDLDRNGTLDMIMPQDAPSGGVLLLKGRGDGTFLPPVHLWYQAGQNDGHIALADLNGDGFPEIVRSNAYDQSVHVLRSYSGSWTAWESRSYAAGGNCTDIFVRDFDEDGRLDVICSNPGMDSVSLLRGDVYGQLAQPQVFGVRTDLYKLGVLDVNADGRLDIITGGGPTITQGSLILQR
ncbi:hypothetical protein BON30_39795 [Cystobacter ferrugineus]|uniref:Fibronectin type-III domain-containing protein n=1 Tax=Cystobacter ferrugineus TaxID=83449 RepID=A0A1L9AYW7_9BACT|nr:hypothetical protein BON30_39795 [Cystobacter ferrugineus]